VARRESAAQSRRQTVLPPILKLGVKRTAQALSGWLATGSSPSLTFKPDLDTIDALTGDRDALWTRLQATSFLTDDEKRAAIGYGPQSRDTVARKFNPYHDDRGRFDFAPDDPSEDDPDTPVTPDFKDPDNPTPEDAAKKKGGLPKAVWDWTVRKFVEQICKGNINRELPGEFEDMTIKDVIDLAKGGDVAASKCHKLLKENRFRK
jgi:hypothetical protein